MKGLEGPGYMYIYTYTSHCTFQGWMALFRWSKNGRGYNGLCGVVGWGCMGRGIGQTKSVYTLGSANPKVYTLFGLPYIYICIYI